MYHSFESQLITTIDNVALHVDQGTQVDAMHTDFAKTFIKFQINAYLQNLHTMVRIQGHY